MHRSLGRLEVTCLGLNAIVGSGIFLLPDDLYRELGVWSPVAFLACALGLLPIAWCYARASAEHRESGGPYLYATTAFGRHVGFAVGWLFFANSVFSSAAVAAAAAGYALPILGAAWRTTLATRALAVLAIALFGALNYLGAKPGAKAVTLFTLAKFLVLLVLVGALAERGEHSSASAEITTAGWGGLGRATFVALFAAQGFEVVGVPAGDAARPERDVPFAALGSLLGATLLYVLVQTVLVREAGARLATPSDAPLAEAALQVAPWLAIIVTLGGLVSTLGFVSGTALGTPRMLYAMAEARDLTPSLAVLHPRYQTPHVAVVVTAGLTAACAAAFDYRALLGMSNVTVGLQYLATCLAVAKQQRAAPKRWTNALPWLGAAVSAWIFTEATAEELLWAGASLLAGLCIQFASRRH